MLSILGTGSLILEFVLFFWLEELPLGHSEILSSPPGFQFLLAYIPCSWGLIKVVGWSEWAKLDLAARRLSIFDDLSAAELCGDSHRLRGESFCMCDAGT